MSKDFNLQRLVNLPLTIVLPDLILVFFSSYVVGQFAHLLLQILVSKLCYCLVLVMC